MSSRGKAIQAIIGAGDETRERIVGLREPVPSIVGVRGRGEIRIDGSSPPLQRRGEKAEKESGQKEIVRFKQNAEADLGEKTAASEKERAESPNWNERREKIVPLKRR